MSCHPDLRKTDLTSPGHPIRSWRELLELYEARNLGPTGDWIFRGLENSHYRLETTLERAVIALSVDNKSPTLKSKCRALSRNNFSEKSVKRDILDLEGGLIRRFKRECRRFVQPAPSKPLEVLALMQHYSAPTRLQDWTHSFYIAVFFAIETASPQRSETCAVWALNQDWFANKRLKARYSTLYDFVTKDRNLHKNNLRTFNKVFRSRKRFVCPVKPYFLSDRQIVQQGMFLCPGDPSATFEENLLELQYDRTAHPRSAARGASDALLRFEISTKPETRNGILRELYRMNITGSSLFPGLQGFARSLAGVLAMPDILAYGDEYEDDE